MGRRPSDGGGGPGRALGLRCTDAETGAVSLELKGVLCGERRGTRFCREHVPKGL